MVVNFTEGTQGVKPPTLDKLLAHFSSSMYQTILFEVKYWERKKTYSVVKTGQTPQNAPELTEGKIYDHVHRLIPDVESQFMPHGEISSKFIAG